MPFMVQKSGTVAQTGKLILFFSASQTNNHHMTTQMQMSKLEESVSKYVDAAHVPAVVGKLRSALGLSGDVRLNDYWLVGDYDKVRQLYSCHFTSPEHVQMLVDHRDEFAESDQRVLLGMRGVVVHVPNDGSASRVVTRGFGYTPTCTVDDVLANHQVGEAVYKFTDYNGGVHTIDFAAPTTHSTILSEGCVLRITKFNGEYLRTTNRKLNTERSRWGSSPLFVDMYRTLGGPELEELFPADLPSSSLTHLFMIVHPALQVASRYSVGEGHLMYLGYVSNDPAGVISVEELDASQAWKYKYECVSVESTVKTDGGDQRVYPVCPPTVKCGCDDPKTCAECTVGKRVIIPTVLDRDGVEHALTIGNSAIVVDDLSVIDQRKRPSEAVIVQFVDAESGANRIVRLCSVAHNWRTAVNNNQNNRYYQFVSHHSMVLAKDLKPKYPDGTPLHIVFNGQQGVNYTYSQLFPYVATPTVEQMKAFSLVLGDAGEEDDHGGMVWQWMLSNYLPEAEATKVLTVYDKTSRRDLRDIKIANIAACMLCALPYAHILPASNFYPAFVEQRDKVISYMCANYSVFKGVPPPRSYRGSFYPGYVDFELGVGAAGTRVTGGAKLSSLPAFLNSSTGGLNLGGSVVMRLYKASADYVGARVAQGMNTKQTAHGVRVLSVFEMATDNIRNLIFKEQGPTLYALLTTMSKHMQYVPKVSPAADVAVPGGDEFPSLPGGAAAPKTPGGVWGPKVDSLPIDVAIAGDTM